MLIVVTMVYHEMWADELKAWMIARESGSVLELLRNIRYEGHPALWYLVLFTLSRVTRDPLAMQVVNAIFAITSIYLVARFAPFTWLQRALFAFGYFAIYGYGVVARGYALGMLLTVVACVGFGRARARGGSLIPLALVLALLALSSVYGVILAGTFGAALLADCFVRQEGVAPSVSERLRRLAPLAAIDLGAAGIAAAQMLRARETFGGTGLMENSAKTVRDYIPSLLPVWSGYFPIPRLDRIPLEWNSDLGTALADSITRGIMLNVIVMLLLVTVLASLARRPVAMLFYLVGTGGILLFSHLIFSGALYHHGHLFLVLVASFWIAAFYPDASPWAWPPARLRWPGTRLASALLTVVLGAQAIAGVLMAGNDILWTFSPGREVARILASPRFASLPIMGEGGPASETVSGYLDRPVYSISTGKVGTYVRWNLPNSDHSRDSLLRATLYERVTLEQPAAALVLDRDLPAGKWPGLSITPVARIVRVIGPPVASRLYVVRRTGR